MTDPTEIAINSHLLDVILTMVAGLSPEPGITPEELNERIAVDNGIIEIHTAHLLTGRKIILKAGRYVIAQ